MSTPGIVVTYQQPCEKTGPEMRPRSQPTRALRHTVMPTSKTMAGR
jgi:hypothetical protein